MIQAPQVQYIPTQQQQQQMQPVAYSPVQYTQPQTPGVIYNYPTASSYMPVQSYTASPYVPAQPYNGQKSQYNGVNIEIINPQGQAGVPQQQYQMPAQYYYPQQPVMMPTYPAMAPQTQIPAQQPVVPQPQVPSPAPAAAPVVDQSNPVNPAISPETFAGRLASSDVDAQRATIEEIAEKVKNNTDEGNLLLDTQIFDALTNIINKDTSSLEGPSPDVIALRQKPADQLTQEEKDKASTPSPLEKAEINKQYALYTIAYMQERLNNELIKRNGHALELKDLPAIENVINTVKSNPNPMLRIAGISALNHIVRPEYKADLATIFELAKADEDPRVKENAESAAQKLSA